MVGSGRKSLIRTLAKRAWRRGAPRAAIAVFLCGAAWQATTVGAFAWQAEKAASQAEASARHTGAAYPKVSLGAGVELKFLGEVSEEGKIRISRLDRLFSMTRPRPSGIKLTPEQAAMRERADAAYEDEQRRAMPPDVQPSSIAQPMEDYEPPAHAVEVSKKHSVVGGFMNSLVAAAYGPKRLLISPEAVTTDSRDRVLIADRGVHAVHVLDRDSKLSFQIVGGPGRRLEEPRAVAVDGDDNIYVSDAKRGLVLVYDPRGQYLRSLGGNSDEPLFKRPSGIAIGRVTQRLYVADPADRSLTVLDLRGHVLDRVEAEPAKSPAAAGAAPHGLQHPTSVVLHNHELVVLDSGRILLLNLHGALMSEFPVANNADWRTGVLPGLFVDARNNIYVSDPPQDVIREYSPEGKLLAVIGTPGIGRGEFSGLAGMWADSGNHVYIADSRRIQVYQLVLH